MDHAATTDVDPDVIDAMLPYFRHYYGNPSSLHSFGAKAAQDLEDSRLKVAKGINARPEEIIFTSGGTESDNLAIKGIAYKNSRQGKHIITSKIEHPAVLNTCRFLEKKGFEVTYVPVDNSGIVNIEDLKDSIRTDTILISIMHANNEIGTLQPIDEISKIAKTNEVYFHTDAVQTVGKIPIDMEKIDVDLMSLSSHKIHGPKGVGALYIKKGVSIEPILHGGEHERGIRSGTENIAGIIGFAKAFELATSNLENNSKKMLKLRNHLIESVKKRIPESYLNGHQTKCLPNIANLRFSFIEGESIVLMLDMKGIAASTGSACSSKNLKASHVLESIGLQPEVSHGSIRFSLGKDNTLEEVDYVVDSLETIIKKLREMSPIAKM